MVKLGRCRVVEVEVVAEVVDTVAEQMHDAALGDLALEPGEELVPSRLVDRKAKYLNEIRLGFGDECC